MTHSLHKYVTDLKTRDSSGRRRAKTDGVKMGTLTGKGRAKCRQEARTIIGIERFRRSILEFSIAFIHCQGRDRWIVIHSSQVKRSPVPAPEALCDLHPHPPLPHQPHSLAVRSTNISSAFHPYNLQTLASRLFPSRVQPQRSIIILEIEM